MPQVFLDEASHVYWDKEQKKNYDSVTTIIKALGLSRNYENISSFYSERGKAVHKVVELVDKGTLLESTVSDVIKPYLEGYRKFLRDSGYKPHAWEVALGHEVLRFAGTIDKVGYLPKLGLGIMDVKTGDGTIDPAVEDQLCGYDVLWSEDNPDMPAMWRYALQLRSNGTYALITKYSKAPVEDWLSIMTVFRKKQKRAY